MALLYYRIVENYMYNTAAFGRHKVKYGTLRFFLKNLYAEKCNVWRVMKEELRFYIRISKFICTKIGHKWHAPVLSQKYVIYMHKKEAFDG